MSDVTGRGASEEPPAAWYRDPWGLAPLRWWDGRIWTTFTAGGQGTPAARDPSGPARAGSRTFGSAETVAEKSPAAVTAPQPAAPSLERSQRRRLLVEVVIVLAIFPLPYVLNAVAALIQAIVTGSESGRIPLPITGHLGLSFLVDLPLILEPLAAAALVIYLLRISGEGGGRAIGLDSSDPRKDLALWLPVFLLCFLIPQLGVGFLLNAAHVAKVTPAAQHLPGYFAILTIADSLQAGIVEEIVVLGFLVRRLEQLGLRPTAVVVLAVLVRISYHVYYGWGVLPILAWALMSVIVYRRYRRLWPFIVVHALWDATIAYLPDLRSVLGLEVIVLSVATFVFWLMWRNRLTRTPDTSAWGPDRRAR